MTQVELTEADVRDPETFEAIVYTAVDLRQTARAAHVVHQLITHISCS